MKVWLTLLHVHGLVRYHELKCLFGWVRLVALELMLLLSSYLSNHSDDTWKAWVDADDVAATVEASL